MEKIVSYFVIIIPQDTAASNSVHKYIYTP